MKSTTTLKKEWQDLTSVFTPANADFGLSKMNDLQRYLVQKYYQNERVFTTATIAGQKTYPVPPNYLLMRTVTLQVGSITWPLVEVKSRERWDWLNIIQYTSDVPQFFYIENGQLSIYPTPASNGNTISQNYKIRLVDLSQDDYTTGTVSATNGSTSIVGSGTTWNYNMVNRWIRIPMTSGGGGDNNWYQIAAVIDPTHITLYNTYLGVSVSGQNYAIGEMPILQEDFHDMLLYGAAMVYYSSKLIDDKRFEQFERLYDVKLGQLNAFASEKTSNVDLFEDQIVMINPNNFLTY
jgi:hypothetical protein